MNDEKKAVIDYGDINPARSGDFALPLLTDAFADQTFEITKVRFAEGNFGPYAVVTVGNKEYRTSSKVVVKQLKNVEDALKSGFDSVRVTLRRVKRYYTFE